MLPGSEFIRMPSIFGDIGTEDTVRQLIGVAASDRDFNIRCAALEAIGGFGGPVSFMYLRDVLLNEEDEELRAVAASSLGNVGSPAALRILKKIIDDPNEKSDLVKSRSLSALNILREID